MRLLNWTRRFSRRGFLAGSATAVAAVAATGGTVLADAQAAPAEDAHTQRVRTLVKFARDLFPHDRLDDSFYARAIVPLQKEAAKDPSVRRLLYGGIDQLNRLAVAASGRPYADVAGETTRAAIIEKIEAGAFFKKVYDDTIVGLYNQPEVWAKFGYEGPSSAKGGYLHRGFSDISWPDKA
ncbi:MAG TPA: hypothetical protein VGR97_11000 [Candidatus Acidoferrales bacterium]|nr:hypothetical protein [Candidatus Acidoferrales bacterium]